MSMSVTARTRKLWGLKIPGRLASVGRRLSTRPTELADKDQANSFFYFGDYMQKSRKGVGKYRDFPV